MGLADQPGRAAFGWGAALALLSPYCAGGSPLCWSWSLCPSRWSSAWHRAPWMGTFLCALVLVRATNGWQSLGRVGRQLLLPSQGSDYFGCFLACLLVLSLSELERVRGDVDFCGRTQHELRKICSIWHPVISRENLVSLL